VNKDLKLSLNMVKSEISYTLPVFITTSPHVISVGPARETLYEGKADYCMIVCEYCLFINRVHILLLPRSYDLAEASVQLGKLQVNFISFNDLSFMGSNPVDYKS
jgi:hypothetical protein